jgi:S-adenosylmethionine hydrolase
MAPIITLTTDFGTADAYVASMKGVILGLNPEAVIVDITHAVEPQNILKGPYTWPWSTRGSAAVGKPSY